MLNVFADTKHEAIPAENVPSRDLFTIVGKHNLSDDDADVDSIASDDSINSRGLLVNLLVLYVH